MDVRTLGSVAGVAPQTRDEPTPLVPTSERGLGDRLVRAFLSLALRTSLVFSPRPTVFLLRRVFAAGGEAVARSLVAHTPANVTAVLDERYADEADAVLDLYLPEPATGALPTVVWVHGGGWIGGSKEELAGYCKLVASKGYAVAAPRYALAPAERYPTPTRQLLAALHFLQANSDRLRLDTSRIVVAGDSAGAQIAAQVGALVTTPGYAEAVGVAPTITPAQLRGLVLACGPYDLALFDCAGRSATARRVLHAVGWAYSGRRRFLADPRFRTISVANHVTSAFPPVLVSVGNADPLRRHSEALVERLRAEGVEPETLFFPADHEPPLNHEYQFDLDTAAGQLFLERLLGFLGRRLHEPAASP